MTVHIPYGKHTFACELSDAAVLTSHVDQLRSPQSGLEIVRRAHGSSNDSLHLEEAGARQTDLHGHRQRPHTSGSQPRYSPAHAGGAAPAGIRRSTLRCSSPPASTAGQSRDELRAKLGDDVFLHEKVVVHDCRDKDSNVKIGTLPSGAPLVIDRLAAETDLLVSEGFIEPHFFAGFSGGRKSVLPGICDQVTVLGNHCSRFIDSQYARTGILRNNPLHRDMLAAAHMAKLAYIVNVVIDEDKNTVAAFAGEMEQAHEAGCDFLSRYCEVRAAPADIVITSNGGAPLDQNIYQCVKGLTAAEASAKEGAVLIMCAGLADGHGRRGLLSLSV